MIRKLKIVEHLIQHLIHDPIQIVLNIVAWMFPIDSQNNTKSSPKLIYGSKTCQEIFIILNRYRRQLSNLFCDSYEPETFWVW